MQLSNPYRGEMGLEVNTLTVTIGLGLLAMALAYVIEVWWLE